MTDLDHNPMSVTALVAALRAVLSLHQPTPSDIYPHDVCHHPHCTDPTDQMEQSPYPCPTVTAIQKYLGETEIPSTTELNCECAGCEGCAAEVYEGIMSADETCPSCPVHSPKNNQ